MQGITRFRWVAACALLLAATVAGNVATARAAWLGVYTQTIDGDLRDGLDLKPGVDGLLVNQVIDGSPADRAGLRKGDVILSIDGHSVGSPEELRSRVQDLEAGRTISLALWRDGEKRNLEVRLAERQNDTDMRAPDAPETPDSAEAPELASPDGPPEPPTPPRAPRVHVRSGGDPQVRIWKNGREIEPQSLDDLKDLRIEGLPNGDFPGVMGFATGRGRLGVRIETLSEDLASALGAPGANGVLVVEVMKDTPAERAGLKSGDIITHVAGTSVSNADDLVRALRDRDAGRVSLSLVRRGTKRTVDAEIGSASSTLRWNTSGGRNDSFFGNPEPGKGRQGYRVKVKDDGGNGNGEDADLQQELRDLRRQISELRAQLRELRK